MPVEVYVHIANVLFLLSYLVREIFILRVLTVVAGLVLLPYYFLVEGGPLIVPIIWSFVFSGVNIYQLIALFRERRPVKLTIEDQQIYQMGFAEFTLRQFSKLLKVGKRQRLNDGEIILEKGIVPNRVMLVLNGEAMTEQLSAIPIGELIGDVYYVTKTPVNSNVNAKEGLEVLFWEQNELEKLLKSDPELRSCWQSMISSRLAKRIAIV